MSTMREPKELLSLLEMFRPFLRSIDIRIFAVRSPLDGEWENLITCVNVSEKTIDEVKRLHDRIPKIKNNKVELS